MVGEPALSQVRLEVRERVSREEFANRLTRLYLAAGSPPSKSVVRRVNMRSAPGSKPFSGQRVSDWRLGRSVPAKFDSVLPLLAVLIEEAKARTDIRFADTVLFDLREWYAVWARARDVTSSTPRVHAPPYRGAAPYRPEDAEIFSGRRGELAELEFLIASAAAGRTSRLVLLLGAAGSGKSSLLAAGLPEGEKPSVIIYLDADPVSALRVGVSAIDGAGLLIVDQAEDLFTRYPDEFARQRFLDELDRLTSATDSADVVVLLAFRSEYRADIAGYRMLAAALEASALTLGPLPEDELREVITRPVQELGWQIEPALVEVVLRDAELLGLREDPALVRLLAPLLAAVWERRIRQTSTLAAYLELGGLAGAVAARAEQVWADLTECQRLVARRILLSLLIIGPRSASRDLLSRQVLLDESPSPGTADLVIERLVLEGLLETSGDGVELRHDALLTGWPRLAGWIADERALAPRRRRIDEDAREWAANGKPRGLLYHGERLRAALELIRDEIVGNRVAREFLRAAQRWQSDRYTLLGALLVAVVLAVRCGLTDRPD